VKDFENIDAAFARFSEIVSQIAERATPPMSEPSKVSFRDRLRAICNKISQTTVEHGQKTD